MGRQFSKVQLAQLASRQWGRVTWAQIKALGVDNKAVSAWLKQGYLHRRLPGVFAVGHSAGDIKADLSAALLYAGPGAMLSHATAAWWWGLLDDPTRLIHVSTPRQCRSQPGVKVHARRTLPRIRHNGLPTTTLPQTFLDLAATEPLRTVRRALAKADYARILNLPAIQAALGPGRLGTPKLRTALRDHDPRLARTKSQNEVLFLEIIEAAGLPMPETNVYIAGWEVDALWREQRIAVEIDGPGNHRSPAQVRRDRRKELALRKHGLTPIRYSDEQLRESRGEIIAELTALL
ncbi:MAG TPA: type IV toxin-antitoxin system AbiEi family antitoxin domain-containing protein [Solirubrobacteraceae bacterium]|nr:type IV toxin-antitoxin system AbiEi family antitoxin domain-containing protein [Solirubrobacteraceae bacterium]